MKKIVTIKREVPYRGYTRERTRVVRVGSGLPDVDAICEELDGYRDILFGRVDAPVKGILALMECADMFYARAAEIEQQILRGERDGTISASSALSRFRKGELRSFKEMAYKAAELGSRRLTAASLESQGAMVGRESSAY